MDGCPRLAWKDGRCGVHAKEERENRSPICAVEDCDRPRFARLWCQKHYLRWWKHGDPLMVKPGGWPPQRPTCAACGAQSKAKGLCANHYGQARYWARKAAA